MPTYTETIAVHLAGRELGRFELTHSGHEVAGCWHAPDTGDYIALARAAFARSGATAEQVEAAQYVHCYPWD